MYHLLALLNWISPKDRTSRRLARNVPYGPHRRQRLDVYAPRGGERPWPVIYFVYGGSWAVGSRGYYEFVGRALAAMGFVVVIADYRLIPQVEYPVFLDDCTLGFGWIIDHVAEYGGDPQRVALMGHSAGAYNAIMLLLQSRQLPEKGLAGSVRAFAGLSGPYDFYPFDVAVSIRAFGAVREPKSTQPVNLVRDDLPPMFLATGEADTLVQPRNTVALAAGMRAVGTEVVERHYPGVGHAGLMLALGALNRGKASVLADVTQFLRAHV